MIVGDPIANMYADVDRTHRQLPARLYAICHILLYLLEHNDNYTVRNITIDALQK